VLFRLHYPLGRRAAGEGAALDLLIRGILFDIGDTLVPATDIQRRSLAGAARDLAAEGLLGDPDSFVRAYEAAAGEPQFDRLADLNHLYSDVRILERASRLLSEPFDPRRAERFLAVYRGKVREGVRPDAGVSAALGRLRAEGMRLGVVSNGTTAEQREQLRLMRVEEFFDPVLISQEVGVRKPDPAIMLIAARRWGLPAVEVLVVGDRADWDVLGAARAGMRSALTTQFVDRSGETLPGAEPDLIVGDLAALPDAIRRHDDTSPVRRREPGCDLPQGERPARRRG